MGVIWVVMGQWSGVLTITMLICCRTRAQKRNFSISQLRLHFFWVKRKKMNQFVDNNIAQLLGSSFAFFLAKPSPLLMLQRAAKLIPNCIRSV